MILVDPLRWHTDRRTGQRRRWAHLVATGGERELRHFALTIGMKSEWYQKHERHPHYDVQPRLWNLAQVAGAMLVSRRDLARLRAVPICARFPACEKGSRLRMSPDLDIAGIPVCSRECGMLVLLSDKRLAVPA